MPNVNSSKEYEDLEDAFERYMKEGIFLEKKEPRLKKEKEKTDELPIRR